MAGKRHSLQGSPPSSDAIEKIDEMLDELYRLTDSLGHELLGPIHTDTVEADVTRGGLIVGQIDDESATVKWMLLPIGDGARLLRSDGVDASWDQVDLTTDVTQTLPAVNGGTGHSVYAVGDLLYADTTTTLARLADVATGNALISGGVNTAPSWGKIGLTTHVSGTLPVANGGTGRATHTAYAVICGGTDSTAAQQSVASVGTSGQLLTSNGAGALPTFEDQVIWEPLTNGDPDDPELIFADGDVIMVES